MNLLIEQIELNREPAGFETGCADTGHFLDWQIGDETRDVLRPDDGQSIRFIQIRGHFGQKFAGATPAEQVR